MGYCQESEVRANNAKLTATNCNQSVVLNRITQSESIIQTDIDLADVEIARGNRPILRDIRSSVYHDLYEISRFQSTKKK